MGNENQKQVKVKGYKTVDGVIRYIVKCQYGCQFQITYGQIIPIVASCISDIPNTPKQLYQKSKYINEEECNFLQCQTPNSAPEGIPQLTQNIESSPKKENGYSD